MGADCACLHALQARPPRGWTSPVYLCASLWTSPLWNHWQRDDELSMELCATCFLCAPPLGGRCTCDRAE